MNIFVQNFPRQTNEENLKELFENFGQVSSVKIIKDRHTQESRCFGFIEINFNSNAADMIKELNGKKYNGRILIIKKTEPRSFSDRNKY